MYARFYDIVTGNELATKKDLNVKTGDFVKLEQNGQEEHYMVFNKWLNPKNDSLNASCLYISDYQTVFLIPDKTPGNFKVLQTNEQPLDCNPSDRVDIDGEQYTIAQRGFDDDRKIIKYLLNKS